jgi:hypothetical protein
LNKNRLVVTGRLVEVHHVKDVFHNDGLHSAGEQLSYLVCTTYLVYYSSTEVR